MNSKIIPLTESKTVVELVSFLCMEMAKLKIGERYILGIVGYPGAGKSTVSDWLAKGVNEHFPGLTKVVPMDGYHFSNEKLEELHLRELKGIPDTFDAHGFVDLLRRLRTTTDQTVYCPLFDRSIEASIPDAIVVTPEHMLCIVEGNYLLFEKEPWHQCKEFFDEVWFLDTTFDTILPRLIDRHIQSGRTPEGAKAKVDCTDMPNARLIEQTKIRATRVIAISNDP